MSYPVLHIANRETGAMRSLLARGYTLGRRYGNRVAAHLPVPTLRNVAPHATTIFAAMVQRCQIRAKEDGSVELIITIVKPRGCGKERPAHPEFPRAP